MPEVKGPPVIQPAIRNKARYPTARPSKPGGALPDHAWRRRSRPRPMRPVASRAIEPGSGTKVAL